MLVRCMLVVGLALIAAPVAAQPLPARYQKYQRAPEVPPAHELLILETTMSLRNDGGMGAQITGERGHLGLSAEVFGFPLIGGIGATVMARAQTHGRISAYAGLGLSAYSNEHRGGGFFNSPAYTQSSSDALLETGLRLYWKPLIVRFSVGVNRTLDQHCNDTDCHEPWSLYVGAGFGIALGRM